MPAYPFGWNPPTLGDFVQKCVQEFGARVVESDYEVEGDFGQVTPKALERSEGQEHYHVILPNLDDDVLLDFHLVRQLCNRLHIPISAFGFEFDRDGNLREV